MSNDSDPKSLGESCLQFYDERRREVVNLVPFEKGPFVPRVGDTVELPGQGPKYGAGTYRVTKVLHSFWPTDDTNIPEPFGPAKLHRVTISVERVD
jgi:hypothetical protein